MAWQPEDAFRIFRSPGDEVQIRRLHQECRARAAQFDLPDYCDISSLCRHIGDQLSHRINLLSIPLQGCGFSGIWLALPDADFIVYEEHTSRPHQEHIIAHELGHLLCGHIGSTLNQQTADLLFPDLDTANLNKALKRHAYSEFEERQAEVMAGVISEKLAINRRPRARPSPTEAPHIIRRIRRSLG